MQPRIAVRLSLFSTIAVILAACSGTGRDGLAAISGPGPVGGTPTPVATFNLHVTVARPQPGADTLTALDRVAGAKVAVLKEDLGTGTGTDTLVAHSTLAVLVATGVTDADGQVTFTDLPAAGYRVEAEAPDGSVPGTGSTALPEAYVTSRELSVQVLLH